MKDYNRMLLSEFIGDYSKKLTNVTRKFDTPDDMMAIFQALISNDRVDEFLVYSFPTLSFMKEGEPVHYEDIIADICWVFSKPEFFCQQAADFLKENT